MFQILSQIRALVSLFVCLCVQLFSISLLCTSTFFTFFGWIIIGIPLFVYIVIIIIIIIIWTCYILVYNALIHYLCFLLQEVSTVYRL